MTNIINQLVIILLEKNKKISDNLFVSNMTLIDKIKSKIDFLEELGKLVTLVKKGINYWACCPFHMEKTPSLCVNSIKKIYHCFGCGAHGDLFSFRMAIEGKTFREVVLEYAKEFNIPISKQIESHQYAQLMNILQDANRVYLHSLNERARNYLISRGVTQESITFFNIGFANGNVLIQELMKQYSIKDMSELGLCNPQYATDRLRERVIFPIMNLKGEVIAFSGRTMKDDEIPKYINTIDSPVFSKCNELYNQQNMTKQKVFVVEGYLDVIALHQINEPAVGIMSTSITEQQAHLIMNKNKEVYLMFDGDNAGQVSILRNIKVLLPFLKIYHKLFVIVPQKGKDPMELYVNGTLKEEIANRIPVFDWINNYFGTGIDPHDKAKILQEKSDLCNLITNTHLQYAYKQHLIYGKINVPIKPQRAPNKEIEIICCLLEYPQFVQDFGEELIRYKFSESHQQVINNFLSGNMSIEEYIAPYYYNLKKTNLLNDLEFTRKYLGNLLTSNSGSKVIDFIKRVVNVKNKKYNSDANPKTTIK